ncbi:MAG: sulfotransferase [Halioglobus sp.]
MKKKNKKKNIKSKKQPLLLVSLHPQKEKTETTYQNAITQAYHYASSGNRLAEYILFQLIELSPQNLQAYLLLLDFYLVRSSIDQATGVKQAILARFPNNSHAIRDIAKFFLVTGDSDEALRLTNQAIELAPEDPSNYIRQGNILNAKGQSKLALDAYFNAIEVDSHNPTALLQLARSIKTNMPPEKVDHIEKLLISKEFQDVERAKLHFAAAWSYGDRDIENNFKNLDAGNKIITSHHQWDQEKAAKEFDLISKFISANLVKNMDGAGDFDKKPIMIASMPRSGSTLLEQILNAHSKTCAIGESNAFLQAVAAAGREKQLSPRLWEWPSDERFSQYIPIIDKYWENNYFVSKADKKRAIDKSIDNYQAAGLFLMTFPNARVIHLRRDPMDIVFSCYQQFFESGFNYLFDLKRIAHMILMHEKLMSYWKDLFPEKIMIVHYEDLVNQQETMTRSILGFCNLEWDEACLNFNHHIDIVRTSSDLQVRKGLHSNAVHKWKNYAQYLKPAADILGIELAG